MQLDPILVMVINVLFSEIAACFPSSFFGWYYVGNIMTCAHGGMKHAHMTFTLLGTISRGIYIFQARAGH